MDSISASLALLMLLEMLREDGAKGLTLAERLMARRISAGAVWVNLGAVASPPSGRMRRACALARLHTRLPPPSFGVAEMGEKEGLSWLKVGATGAERRLNGAAAVSADDDGLLFKKVFLLCLGLLVVVGVVSRSFVVEVMVEFEGGDGVPNLSTLDLSPVKFEDLTSLEWGTCLSSSSLTEFFLLILSERTPLVVGESMSSSSLVLAASEEEGEELRKNVGLGIPLTSLVSLSGLPLDRLGLLRGEMVSAPMARWSLHVGSLFSSSSVLIGLLSTSSSSSSLLDSEEEVAAPSKINLFGVSA